MVCYFLRKTFGYINIICTQTQKQKFFFLIIGLNTLLTFLSILPSHSAFYLSTDDISKSVSVASIDQVLKLILQFFYERIWNKIEWGRIKDSESESEIKIKLRESSI